MNMKRAIALVLMIVMLASTPAMADQLRTRQVLAVAVGQLGKPYALAPDAPNSFNCASFVVYCFNAVSSGTFSNATIHVPYKRISSIKKVRAGDIVCFKTSGDEQGLLSYHFGIYMGRGYFIHASNTAKQVIVSKMKSYSGRFLGGMRLK